MTAVNTTSHTGSEAKRRRLATVKAAWYPRNLLRHNKNITPENAG